MHNIDKLTKCHQVISKTISFAAIQDLITDAQIRTICRQLGHIWRQRLLPPTTMVRSMVYRSIHRNRSIKTLLADIAAANIQIQTPTDAA
jgi:isoprenylcysteine carboxyl methyltransferase (ICMT) family protein YpbQ